MTIDLIVGARPNFVKIAALIHANLELEKPLNFRIIHTGQHYDENLSGSFFQQLQIPSPDINLQIGSGTQGEQTAAIMVGYERVLLQEKPKLCVVVGDVTSSMACAITAKKSGVKVAHIEAGIRSNDWSMPEEVNRVLIDSITDYFFTTTTSASNKLAASGVPKESIFFVGNTMIDTLLRFKSQFTEPAVINQLKIKDKEYLLLTLHRPSNVDEINSLLLVLKEISLNSRGFPVIFPVHPRTAKIIKNQKLPKGNLFIIDPLPYLQFNFLANNAMGIITDSGGITEEATVLGVPCMTLRNNTERPETIEKGTNMLLGTDPSAIPGAFDLLFSKQWKKGEVPELWDGKAAKRILKILTNSLDL